MEAQYLTHSQVLCQTQKGSNYVKLRKQFGTWGRSQLPALKGGRGGVLKAPGLNQEEGQAYLVIGLASKSNQQVGQNSFCTFLVLGQAISNLDPLDSPRPGLGGSQHLPPYNILCDFLPHLHPNGSFSRDSQSGVPKLSQF